MSVETIVMIVLVLSVAVLIAVVLTRRQQDYAQSFFLLQQRMGQIEDQVRKSLDEGNRSFGEKYENSLKVIGDIKKTIGSLEETNRQMLSIGRDIAGLQDLLRPPQIRGGLGEMTLNNILREILPGQSYSEQYRFRNGVIVDAVIKIGGRIVPIDAKFPLDSFERFISCTDDREKASCLKEFCRSVKMKIDDISAKYIQEDECTYDFALMYIPSENIYYQTILKNELEVEGKSIAEYALERRVVIVSPNSVYAYLRVIHIGLRGMQFESNIRKILDDYSRLNKELEKFEKQFATLGTHINHAQAAFDGASRQLDTVSNKMARIGESSVPENSVIEGQRQVP
ncbi:MAG: DNA recombination protein RmuC [Dehalococcoidales bacterium]|nr:DNA recombination protein RmuC [Dehalococcoidales bacterium]